MNDGIYTFAGRKDLDGSCELPRERKCFGLSFVGALMVLGAVMAAMALAGSLLKRKKGESHHEP